MVEAATGARIAVFDPIWLKPLPEAQLLELASRFDALLVVEEGVRAGGFSSAVLELLADRDALHTVRIRRLGLPDEFVPHGTQRELREQLGLRADGIAAAVRELLG